MMDAITGALSSITAVRKLGKEISQAKSEAEVALKTREINESIGDVMEKLLAVQTEYSTLLSAKAQLEAEIAKLQDWTQEKQRYQLNKTEAGGVMYSFKAELANGEPAHDLCAKCYQDGIKSILQPAADVGAYQMLKCHACGSDIQVKRYDLSSAVSQPKRQTDWSGL